MFESQVKSWTADQQRRSRQVARWDQLLKNSVAGQARAMRKPDDYQPPRRCAAVLDRSHRPHIQTTVIHPRHCRDKL